MRAAPYALRRALTLGALALTALDSAAVGPAPAAHASPAARPRQPAQPARPARPARPTLVVLVTVDQLRADYLDRFGPQLTGGLGRLARGGARFTDAHHDHAIPETAPGHATLLSGRFPRGTGIFTNPGVADTAAPLLDGARGPGASPRAFRGTTLVDWLRAGDPRTRALSVSAKDRGAILPVGRGREHVYWYAADGRFTTSTYYRDTLPDWVRRFNARDAARRLAGRAWTPLLPDSAYAEPDSVPIEGAGHDFVFPHVLPADSALAAARLPGTPWIDELTLALALEGVRALALGAGPQTDVLAVSLSATDAIGHVYGPESREIHDQLLRLDRALGPFLDSLYRMRDSARVAVVLTGDHGVAPIPELHPDRRPPGVRVDVEPVLGAVREELREAGADTTAVDMAWGLVFADRQALERAGVRPDSVLERAATLLRQSIGVLRVDRFRDLLAADHARDPIARRWAHQLPPGAAVELVVTLTPFSIWWGGNVAAHVTPHDYDTHVPLVFYGPAFRAGRVEGFVRTVDLAPTLAALLGVKPTEPVDGVALRTALR